MGQDHRRKGGGFVEPDLPITPMLDMSFQLLAYFLMTFNPTPTEGHLDVILPAQPGKTNSIKEPDPFSEQQEEMMVRVEADEKGDIAGVYITMSKNAAEESLPGKGREARTNLFKDLQRRLANLRADNAKLAVPAPFVPPKIKLELADNLSFKLVVAIMDECGRAGFPAVAPTMKEDKK